MNDLVGQVLSGYELLEVIRRRRSSTTYRACEHSGRHATTTAGTAYGTLALTVLFPSVDIRAAAAVEPLLRAAQAVAALRHPHIVPVEAAREHGGHVFVVQRYLQDVPTLADRRAPVPTARAAALMVPLLAALAYAHEQGVWHGDLTPRNVLLPSPVWPMLTDFAIGRTVPGMVATGTVLGTAAYVSPEQAFGFPADARSDVYSAAVMVFEMLVGQVPFVGETPREVLQQQALAQPPRPTRLRPDIGPQMEDVLLWAMEKDPARRPQTARELGEALGAAARGRAPRCVARVGEAAVAGPSPTDATDADDLNSTANLDQVAELVAAGIGGPKTVAASYATGVHAFVRERWAEAVEQLTPVAQADAGYADVEVLLERARSSMGSVPKD